MKKTYLGALLFAGTLAFTACQQETIVYVDENGNPVENVDLKEGEGILKINLSNTSAESRSARPVGSSAAANNVNTVKVYVYMSDSQSGSYTLDTDAALKDGQDGLSIAAGVITVTSYSGNVEHANDISTTHAVATIKLTNLTPGKYYKFVAVGYNDGTTGGGNNPYGDPTTIGSDFAFTTSTSKSGYQVEELFAGVSAAQQTTEKANFANSPSVTIERQVAGMLAYFEKVPAQINGTAVETIEVYASANADGGTFTYPSQDDFNGSATSAQETLLMKFDVGTINTGTSENGYYTFNGADATDNPPFAEGYIKPQGLKLKANTVFGGRYLIPYGSSISGNTLVVKLKNSNTVLKTLTVVTNANSVDKKQFNICRNNFYSIGEKVTTDNEPDTDKPIDLSGNTDIVVTINDAWKVLHNMGVEE